MNKLKTIVFILTLALTPLLSVVGPLSAPAANADSTTRLMDNSVFDNVGSMNESQIQAFLAAHGPCLVNYQDVDFNWNGTTWSYGGSVSAAHIIYKAAQQWGINPEVIITTLQKEESLVSGTSCDGWRYNSAMGYGCPDSGGCDVKYAGFSRQVLWGSWQLMFGRERSEGNLAWDGDGGVTYVGFMTQGTFQRCGSCSAAYYNGYATIDGQSIYLENGSTASLYSYTPHLNQSFPGIFAGWFGSVYGYCNGGNLTNVPSGAKIMGQRFGGPETLTLSVMNQTGTGCIEAHTWTNVTGQQWALHTASNSPSADPANSEILTADTNGDGHDEMYKVDYQNTGSGRIEIHGWSPSLLQWTSHVATNRPAVNPADARVIAADLDGSGHDSFYLVQFRNTSSGMIEVHGWSPSLQQWTSHIATNRPAIDPADATVVAANHQLYLVQYRNTSSGMIEIHGWAPGEQQWTSHIASNRPAINPADATIVAVDSSGTGHQQFYLVQYRNTGSGMVEVHGWADSLQQWVLHSATNEPAL